MCRPIGSNLLVVLFDGPMVRFCLEKAIKFNPIVGTRFLSIDTIPELVSKIVVFLSLKCHSH